jgi:hypothetical protein
MIEQVLYVGVVRSETFSQILGIGLRHPCVAGEMKKAWTAEISEELHHSELELAGIWDPDCM